MKTEPQILMQLNRVLTAELTAINQYFLHARMFKNWGLNGLDKVDYKKSIQDMIHADKLIERILFLEGLPNLQQLDKLWIGEDPQEMLQCDQKIVLEQITLLKQSITLCEQQQDFVSRDLLQTLLQDEENHLDWLEAQFELIQLTSLANYLQTQMQEG